jgi:hypothetical protein
MDERVERQAPAPLVGENRVIPRTMHFIWVGPPMPAWICENLEEFRRLNPGWELRVHGEDVLLPEYEAAYRETADICTKADILAVSAVQRYGGWYMDTDFWPFRALDGITEAYRLDGSTMFVTEQHGMRDQSLRTANGVLAAATDWAGWPAVRDLIVNHQTPIKRCDFGPSLFTKLVDERPGLFTVGPWPWFYPAEIGRALRLYPACRAGRANRYATRWAPTGGQLPQVVPPGTGSGPDGIAWASTAVWLLAAAGAVSVSLGGLYLRRARRR